MKLKYKKAYVLVEKGKICHYYSLMLVFFTKTDAWKEKTYRNKILGHKMEVKQCMMCIEA